MRVSLLVVTGWTAPENALARAACCLLYVHSRQILGFQVRVHGESGHGAPWVRAQSARGRQGATPRRARPALPQSDLTVLLALLLARIRASGDPPLSRVTGLT